MDDRESPFELAMLSDAGGGWPTNEDAYGQWQPSEREVLFAIADGVGGNEGGEVASRVAIDTTLRVYRDTPAGRDPGKRLRHAVQAANLAVHNHALAAPRASRMSTTLTAAVVRDGVLWAVHVGDTRLYLLRGDTVRPLTRDHNVASERARLRFQSADAARRDPQRSILTRSLGIGLVASLDRVSLPVLRGDRLVLCTDGVHTLLDGREILDYCRGQPVRAACRSVLAAAKRRSPTDNLTVAVLAVNAAPAEAAPGGWRSRFQKLLNFGD